MNIYRVKLGLLVGNIPSVEQWTELVVGLTPTNYVAQGRWFGEIVDKKLHFPFSMSGDGVCQFSGSSTETESFTIVKRPVVVDEIFELTWEDRTVSYRYKVLSIGGLNT